MISSYYYDPFGRRLWKEVSGVRTYYHYSDEGLIGEYDAAGVEIKTYGYKPGSTWTTDPLFMKVGSDYYFYHTDHLGTPQKMTSVNGAVVWSAKYSSFGKATVEVETVENNLRFPGQYEDVETGLHYNRFRYYDSIIGKYLGVDPKGLYGGINLYTYALSNPLNLIDPNGLFSMVSFRNIVNIINILDVIPIGMIPVVGQIVGEILDLLAFFGTSAVLFIDYLNGDICGEQLATGMFLNTANLLIGTLGNALGPYGNLALSLVEAGILYANYQITSNPSPEPVPIPDPEPEPQLPEENDNIDDLYPSTGWEDTDGDGVPDTYTPPGP